MIVCVITDIPFAELVNLSGYTRSSFRSQSSCSSLNSSVQSTDSLDQFCRDFDSSVNLACSELSLNNASLQVCDNKGQDLCDTKFKSKEQPACGTNEHCLLSAAAAANAEERLGDKTASYEGKTTTSMCNIVL